jgi:tetratricopeptide (TPR) repeat protein
MTVEEQRTFARFPDRTDRSIVRDLFRWHADLLRSLERHDEFLVAVRNSLELVEAQLPELYDAVDWAVDREAWAAVDEVAERFASEFNRHAILVYRQAESQLRRGDDDLADETAARALKIDPNNLDDHVIQADRLHSRLLYGWAEREYRFVIASSQPAKNDGLHMQARFFLADMLVDLEKELAAAKLLEETLELVKVDETVLAPLQKSPAKVEASMHYYFALDFRRKGDRERQIEHLEAAYLLDPENPDILIAMFRAPVIDVVWQETARKRIETLKQSMQGRIKAAEQLVENPTSERGRRDAMHALAQALNELAWLTSNTTGDFSAAVRFSQRSLQLRPGSPAYLDTLGRCFFAAGDVESAVKHQAKAVERAPRYQQIRRQLKTFEDALAQSRGEPK